MEATDVTAVQGEANEQRGKAVKVSVRISASRGGGGGGGILLLGGTLVAAAIGAAFAFHRSRAKKRTLPAPPPPEEKDKPIPAALVHVDESVCEDEKIVQLSKAKKGLQSLIPLVEEEEVDGQTEKRDAVSGSSVEEIQENEKKQKEGDEIGSEEEETESSDGDVREERSDGTGSSSRESGVEAVWPAEVIEKEEDKGMKSKVEPNNTIDHSELKLNGIVELLEIPETIKSVTNIETQVDDDVEDYDGQEDDDDNDDGDDDDQEEEEEEEEFLLNGEEEKAVIPAEKKQSASMAMKSVEEVETHSKVILLLLVLFLAVGLVSMAHREILHGILP